MGMIIFLAYIVALILTIAVIIQPLPLTLTIILVYIIAILIGIAYALFEYLTLKSKHDSEDKTYERHQ